MSSLSSYHNPLVNESLDLWVTTEVEKGSGELALYKHGSQYQKTAKLHI